MAELYLEINEDLTDEELQTKQPLSARVQVSDRDDASAKLKLLEIFFEGRSYTRRLHTCNHDTGAPCADEIL